MKIRTFYNHNHIESTKVHQSSSIANSKLQTTSQIPSPSNQQKRPQDLIVRGDIVRLQLGQRVAFPGDYLVHEQVTFYVSRSYNSQCILLFYLCN